MKTPRRTGDPEAEAEVLGALLMEPERLADVAAVLTPDDFTTNLYAAVFRAIMAVDARGEPVGVVTVARQCELDPASSNGSPVRLEVLNLYEGAGNPASVTHHARIVHDWSLRRRLAALAADYAREAYDPAYDTNGVGASVLVDGMMADLETLALPAAERNASEMPAVLDDAMDALEIRSRGQGMALGFVDLDHFIGGLHPGYLVVVAARPGVGKSALVTNIARNVAGTGAAVTMFSLEMSRAEVGMRLMCAEANVSPDRLRNGHGTEWDRAWARIMQVSEELHTLPITVVDNAAATMVDIRALVRRTRPGLVIVDYLQLMSGIDRKENRQQEVADISRSLKVLAKEVGVPIIAASQLNRQPEMRKGGRPQLSDLRESGAIEQDADLVAFLHRDTAEQGKVEVIIAKHRHGPTGVVPLTYLEGATRFVDYAPPVEK